MTNNHAWPPVYQGELLPEPDPDAPLPPAGIDLPVPDREVHDWDGTHVTSYVRCPVGDHHVWGAGVARDRAEARLRALGAVYAKLSTRSSASTK